ncbi:MAG: M50 family metallopeptidase [Abitibacteriaceae bacterium]|nr:M50 family metallopeptidase [Abditibacteriaceae bacterium]
MSRSWDNDINSLPSTLPPAFAPSATATDEVSDHIQPIWLVLAGMVTIAAWQLPFGNYIAYPFTILATWFHEMGHGLMALLMGAQFDRLLIYPDGSGVAYHTSPAGDFLLGRIKDALVAAAGPMGPPIAGAAFILASRRFKTAHISLLLLGAAMLLATLIWVRSLFGFISIPLMGLLIMAIGLRAPRWTQEFTIQLLGVQACISTFHQLDYLFMSQGIIGGQVMLSDSSQIAQNLLLPYWFWGALMAIGSVVLLLGSLYLAYRPTRLKAPASI